MYVRALLGAALTLSALVACNGSGIGRDGQDVVQQDGVEPEPAEQLLIVSRRDFRECTFPMCGGVYLRAIDADQTLCSDGQRADECYVAAIDVAGLGLQDDDANELEQLALAGQVVMRGIVGYGPYEHGALEDAQMPTLAVSDALVAQAMGDAAADAEFYRVEDTGIVCVTHPCPTMKATRLSSGETLAVAGLDLSALDLDEATQSAASARMFDDGLLVAGSEGSVSGPAGDAVAIEVSELYLPPSPAEEGEPCGQNSCGAGSYCCNASCGMCAPEGAACIQVACAPAPAGDGS
jgi:hypothetical protein